jgi:hypothetical protein
LSFSPYLFSIKIDKLEYYLEDVGCNSPTIVGIAFILLYIDDIFLMARSPCDLNKKLRILKDISSSMAMNVNIEKMKVMIIKS